MATIITAERLRNFAEQVLSRLGLSDEHARQVAEILVESNLRGIDTHGIYLLTLYSRRIEAGLINPRPHFVFVRTQAATGVLDADTALGQLAALEAMRYAVRLAGQTGVASVAVKRSTHFGAAAYYTIWAAQRDMIGLICSHSESDVVPFGGRRAFLGTNPVSVAVPGEHGPAFVMDMATSEVAFGKIRAAAEAGRTIPPNWAVDAEGRPTTDPTKVAACVPMSGPKGFAIALLIEILSSLLTGMAFGPGIVRKFDDMQHPQQLGTFVIAIDPSAFVPLEEFKRRMAELAAAIHAVPPAEGFAKVMIPGEPEELARQRRLKEGIEIPPQDAARLGQLAQRLGLPWPP